MENLENKVEEVSWKHFVPIIGYIKTLNDVGRGHNPFPVKKELDSYCGIQASTSLLSIGGIAYFTPEISNFFEKAINYLF